MPMELQVEMAVEHDVTTEVMALVAVVLGCLNSRKTAHPHQEVHLGEARCPSVGTHLYNGIKRQEPHSAGVHLHYRVREGDIVLWTFLFGRG